MSNNNLPYRQYTSRSETDKAINSLKGILLGISLDQEVKTEELQELYAWCETHASIIDRNPFKELAQTIQYAISEDTDRIEQLQDLIWVCNQYEQGSLYYDLATADLQTLQGICHGILSDGIVNDQEVKSLDNWLEEHQHLNSYYPYDEIYTLITTILADGKIDNEERRRLAAYFSDFVKLNDSELTRKLRDDIGDIKLSGICTSNPNINFEGHNFCFTGALHRATRDEAEGFIKNMGGNINNAVTKKTNYLIVGDSGNPCWAFATYGRKVEKAITLRKEGTNITLIHEFDFWDIVDDTRYQIQ